MSSTNSPVIVLVPGAFGTPACFDRLLPYLKEAGLSTHPGPYPSCNPSDPTTATCSKDIAALRDNVLLPLLDQKKDVVIIAHSYGGIPAGSAAKGLDKQARSLEGHTSSVIGFIYVVGMMALENESLSDVVGGSHPP
ncbi:hypothetical protein F4805DRAFT_418258 [Annulohypoxylon moriforme]|nr:hypothetical protein F4805DRAFT_418258 [Annulohypoxylon moriforme]